MVAKSSDKLLRKRYKAERRFRMIGLLAIIISCAFLGILLTSIISKGYSAFWRTEIRLTVNFDEKEMDPDHAPLMVDIRNADYSQLIHNALKKRFPQVTKKYELFQLFALVSSAATSELRHKVLANPTLIGATETLWLPAASDVDMLMKGKISASAPQEQRKLKDNQLAWVNALTEDHALRSHFNMPFFVSGDSREAAQAGIAGSFIGSILTIIICMLLAFPLAVLSAVYLEEFAPENRLTDFIEVNINNLAAVPSIVFGLLGLSVYLGTAGLPRSSALVGGLTLALMVLPTIVITTRQALKAVPPSIKDGVLALGASPIQVTIDYILPLAMPGIMTGTILAIARALGETAPLIMIGMVAFIADIPHRFTDPATVMPVQIFLWSTNPELGFVEKTSAAIMVLLLLLMSINAVAIVLRKKFERRW